MDSSKRSNGVKGIDCREEKGGVGEVGRVAEIETKTATETDKWADGQTDRQRSESALSQ